MNQERLVKAVKALAKVRDSGCYFLSLFYTAFNREPTMEEIVDWYYKLTEKRFMTVECYIMDPANILKEMTGQRYTVKHSSYYDQNADIAIGCFRVNMGTHFVVLGEKASVKWDPLGEGWVLKNGQYYTYRLFYKV